MEYCTGYDLQALLKIDTKLPESTVRPFIWDIVQGLHYVHSHGIINCNIKPSSFLVDASGVVKLCDFTQSQHVDVVTPESSKVGTPCYMAPELFQQDGVVSFATDLWGLGCVCYELSSGSPPFVDTQVESLITKITTADFTPLSTLVSPAFQQLQNALLTKDALCRADWTALACQPFLGREMKLRPLPVQPAWEKYKTTHATNVGAVGGWINMEKSRGSFGARCSIVHERPLPTTETHSARLSPKEEQVEEMKNGNEPLAGELLDPAPVMLSLHPPMKDIPKSERLEVTKQYEKPASHPCTVLSALLWHPSDTYVKPIMMNPRIEKTPEPKFRAEDLPFVAHPLSTLNQLASHELEAFLTQVYKSIGGASRLVEKYNSLLYFQTLCDEGALANILVNTPLLPLFVRMLQNPTHTPNVKGQLCLVIGLLVRHATYVDYALCGPALLSVLSTLLQDDCTSDLKRVRRRAVACLGELIFYIATQQTDEKVKWAVPGSVFEGICLCVTADDEIVRHYAVKVIENTAGHIADPEFALHFATAETVQALLATFEAGRNEHLRTAAISAVARLCRITPTALKWVVDSLGIRGLAGQLNGANVKTSQALINLLNMILAQCIALHAKSSDPSTHPSFLYSHIPSIGLLEGNDALFLNCSLPSELVVQLQRDLRLESLTTSSLVLQTLEQNSVVLRGKALLCILQLTFCGVKFLAHCCEQKLCVAIERFAKEKDAYFGSCLQGLFRILGIVTTSALSTLAIDMESCASGGATIPALTLENLAVAVHVLTTQTIRLAVCSNTLFQWLARCLVATEAAQVQEREEIRRQLLAVMEAISQDAHVVAPHHVSILANVLPALATLLEGGNGDTRFLCLKMSIDILSHFNATDPADSEISAGICDLMRNLLVPKCKVLFSDEDPIPLYALKLLSTAISEAPQLVWELWQRDLVQPLFDFFELNHRNNNVHNVRLILRIVEAAFSQPGLSPGPLQAILDMELVRKLRAVLAYAYERTVDTFFEPCLDIAYTVLYRAAQDVCAGDRTLHTHSQAIAECLPIFVQLCASNEPSICEVAAHCALLTVQLYPASSERLSGAALPALRQCLAQSLATAQGNDKHSMDVPKLVLQLLQVLTQQSPKQAQYLRADASLQSELQKLLTLPELAPTVSHLLGG
eukprot:TRINITY_DN43244_c0_g1_i1.p1 TRINITY_DN43244_c0_g1~~TRINITY_DN43244_c0_g1_i1.p1  ORF type:complete len:1236 (-),score=180.50 TRINITY_DN43244_c0_g1_i1:7-3477(-)